ncbi:MAG TPA: hypothetical protein VEW93_09345 [Acidimicrobiales bacterium]|nr:hypothetical protein [Acidimicrobiales bacterium]
MFTTGSKWFFGLAAAAFVGALVYGGATAPDEVSLSTFTGVLTFGYKGAVGDHVGYAVLMGLAGAGVFLGATTAAFRDADVDAGAQLLQRDTVPEVVAPPQGSYWPVIAAFGVGFVTVGLVAGQALVLLGLAVLAAATFEWAISAWAEKATGDDAVNRAIRRRVMLPVEVPVLGLLGVAVFVLSMSRILLALPQGGVYALFALVPVLVLVAAFVLAAKPRINPQVVAVLCVVGALAVLAGGVISASVGPREIEPHHAEEEGEGEHEGARPVDPGAPVVVPGQPR